MQIMPATEHDYREILALNAAAVPNVNLIDEDELRKMAAQACYFKVLRDGKTLAGFLLCFAPGADYQSLNYQWFSNKFDDFVYVDRIVISPQFAGQGLGGRFYQDLAEICRGHAARIACEVNIKPRNAHSLYFHQKVGFNEVGQQDTEGGSKRVSLMAWELDVSP